ncbi:hypothetical protein Esti_003245 [Eimeria stiedai]
MRLMQPINDHWSRTPPTNGRVQEPAVLGLGFVPQRRCMRSLSTFWGGVSSGWLLSAAAATCCLAAHARWRRQQNLWVQSGACAAAAPLPAHSQPQVDRHSSCLASSLHHAGSTAVEYVYLKNPQSSAFASAQSSGYRTADLLLFFHGGLCGTDQLLASALRFPPSIEHLLLPNRLGYLRSDPPPPWVDEPRQLHSFKRRGCGEKGELEFARVHRHRMLSQAALLEDLVRQQIRNLSPSLSSREPQLHLLGVGEGCAHAIIYASCFPRKVSSLVLLAPLLELRERPENGALENHILKRIRVYRQLTSRLPTKAFTPRLPPPKISFLEWLAAGFFRLAPKTALSNLLQLTCHRTSVNDRALSSEQLLAALQQQQPMQQLLLQPRDKSSSGGQARSHGNKAVSWRMQQQEAWEKQQAVYRQLLLRLQHLTGSCCLQNRLLGFLEDALILTAHEGAASEEQISTLLLGHLKQLQLPAGLVVLAGGDPHTCRLKTFSRNLERSRWDVLELPEASPKTLLLSHADLLSNKLEKLYRRLQVVLAGGDPHTCRLKTFSRTSKGRDGMFA